MPYYHARSSSFDRTFGFDPEDNFEYFTVYVKVDQRRAQRFKTRIRVESARRELQKLIASDAYRGISRGSKLYRLEQLRILASKSK